ncbi:MAG: ABC transporter ATP-binding protein [Caldimicrobium sp.]
MSLIIKNIFYKHKGKEDYILKDINFECHKGSITVLLGPNGAGKSTLLKCIAGLWIPQRGEVIFEGKNILGLSYKERAKILALVQQDYEPSFAYSVLDVVLMGRCPYIGLFSSPSHSDRIKAEEAMEIVGIAHLKNKLYTKLSGGEKQLVLIARALAQDSPILLLDEPTAHLDVKNQILVLETTREIVKNKDLTVIMTLHDPNLASFFSDRIILLKNGLIVNQGSPSTILTKETLEMVYEIKVDLFDHNGFKIVFPLFDFGNGFKNIEKENF